MKYSKVIILGIITLILFFPLIIMVFTSLKPTGEVITATPTLFPKVFTLQNYIDLFQMRPFVTYLGNSLLVASLTAVITVIAASLAACALVWMKLPGKKAISRSILFTYMFPQILLVIPLFILCYKLSLIDSKFGLVLTYLSFSLPFSIWLLKSYFESMPAGLIECALIEGCSYFSCLIRIVFPVALPAVVTTGILSFILGWSEYLFAATLISSDANRTIAIGLQTLIGYHRVDYGMFTAAGVIMVLPVLILYLLVQKYVMRDLTLPHTK
jgi:ABC-type glycerol-3-phosphate transport system permease component